MIGFKYFTLSEFDCNDGTPYPKKWEERLQKLGESCDIIRAEIGVPLIVNSAYRTPAYNKSVGGAQNSFHMQGVAVDLSPAGKTPLELYNIIVTLIVTNKIPDGGLGLYKSFVHYDIRTILGFGKARWDET